ncbi:MAG: type II toxin-antitoxin system VapC family toxin [Blastocatellia bacterium]
MRILIDTNVFLEVLLNQRQAQAAKDFLLKSDQHEFFISNFALHSICVILLRRRKLLPLEQFLADTIGAGRVAVLSLNSSELTLVIGSTQLLGLDFDDAYQYVVAEKHNLTLASFDSGFDNTPRGRQHPQAIV